jgi:hypothetical protein
MWIDINSEVRMHMDDGRFDAKREQGAALIAALMVMLLMSALMIGFTAIVISDQRFRGIDKDRNRAYYAAQSGLEKLTVDLGNLFLTNVAPTPAQVADLSTHPPTIPDVTFTASAGLTAYGAALMTCDNHGDTLCNGTIQNGPYQGLIALKKVYGLDAIAKTTSGGEAHLTRKVESVAIPVFQFGTFSDVDLSLFAGATFTFGGRIHTNGNLFLTAQDTYTTTLTDKVTAVGDIIRQRMQNGLAISSAGFNGTINAATAPSTYRAIAITEGSLMDGVGSAANTNWPTISLTTYNGNLRNGGCPPVTGCSTPPRGTGAKRLDLPLVTVGGSNPDLVRRPPPGEDTKNAVLFGERMFGKTSLRILLSDTPGDITGLPTVTAAAPVRLGDEGVLGPGLSNDWAAAPPPPTGGVAFLGVGAAIPSGGVMTPIARSPGRVLVNVTKATNVGDVTIDVAGPFAVPYVSPATLTFDIYTTLASATAGFPVFQTVNCQSISPTQFQTCSNPGGGGLPSVSSGYYIKAKDGTAANQLPLQITAAATAGTPKSYTVASTASFVTNSFWMQSNVDSTWSVVTCQGVDSTDDGGVVHPGGNVIHWNTCSGVPKANKSVASGGAGPGITTSALVAQNVGTIGGYLKIEVQKTDRTWQDVTMEILNWGFADKNQDGTVCGDPTPNAIIRLQRLRDNANACHYSNSVNSYDYWPNTIFDTREGLFREPAPLNKDIILGGVMHYVAIDVGNLSKWFKKQPPYDAGSGSLALLDNNGYSVYFSDRRNNRDLGSLETGEYGFEDIVNPGTAAGTPNGALDPGEDFNGNGTLETYGQFPNFLGVRNALPPGAIAPFDDPNNIRPWTTLGRSAAMTNREYLFRRALKLQNGGYGNIVMPGFTVVSENPVYIQGDWNWNSTVALTDPHSETSVIADAVTLLSNAWTDANAFRNPYSATLRPRAMNWYRLAIIGGKGPAFPWPAAGTPNSTFGTDGGAHNFLRYLEGGSGVTTNFRGSIATFYYSRQGTGTYKYGTSVVYNAPNRSYAFDTDFLDPAKLPPLTPMFRDINALGFTQETRPGR